jgi:hypothetical protein
MATAWAMDGAQLQPIAILLKLKVHLWLDLRQKKRAMSSFTGNW